MGETHVNVQRIHSAQKSERFKTILIDRCKPKKLMCKIKQFFNSSCGKSRFEHFLVVVDETSVLRAFTWSALLVKLDPATPHFPPDQRVLGISLHMCSSFCFVHANLSSTYTDRRIPS